MRNKERRREEKRELVEERERKFCFCFFKEEKGRDFRRETESFQLLKVNFFLTYSIYLPSKRLP